MTAPSLSARTCCTVQQGTAQWRRRSLSADESGWDRSRTACLAAVGWQQSRRQRSVNGSWQTCSRTERMRTTEAERCRSTRERRRVKMTVKLRGADNFGGRNLTTAHQCINRSPVVSICTFNLKDLQTVAVLTRFTYHWTQFRWNAMH